MFVVFLFLFLFFLLRAPGICVEFFFERYNWRDGCFVFVLFFLVI